MFFFGYFFTANSIWFLSAMQDSALTKRGSFSENSPQAKVQATAIAQFEHRAQSEKITLPLTTIIEAHLASNTP